MECVWKTEPGEARFRVENLMCAIALPPALARGRRTVSMNDSLVGFGLSLPQIFRRFADVSGLRRDHTHFHFELLQGVVRHC